MKNSKNKYPKGLVLASFSKTIARTHEFNLEQQNIDTAFADSIEIMFGREGVFRFEDMGGRNSSLPIQIIFRNILAVPSCYQHLCTYLDVAQVENVDLVNADPTPQIFQEFVELNVELLGRMIGSPCTNQGIWPEIYSGVREFLNALKSRNIDFGIISSSYEGFIREVFDFHSLLEPLFCITPDDKFNMLSVDWVSKMKPSKMLIAAAIEQWAVQYPGIDADYALDHTILIGDDYHLDGQMARDAGLPFWYFSSTVPSFKLLPNEQMFSNYGQLARALAEDKLFF